MVNAERNVRRLELRRTDARRPADHVDRRHDVHKRRTAHRGRRSRRDRTSATGRTRRRQSDTCWRASADTGDCGMSELIIERAAPALEPVGDGWTLYGRAVPYGIESLVRDPGGPDYSEEFVSGAASRDVNRGGAWINLMVGHDGDDGERFLGRCVALEELVDGLYPTFRIN